jgi:predicted Zn-dependent protease with MMP-like domain
VKREEFLTRVDEALASIPEEFRRALINIAIVIEDEPSAAQLAEVGVEPPDTLLGLYQGTPITERQWAHGNVLPDKITLFQLPIEESSDDEDDLVRAIGETLIHEVGHYFGLSEEEIEEIEQRYWYGDGNDTEDSADPEGAEDSEDTEDAE